MTNLRFMNMALIQRWCGFLWLMLAAPALTAQEKPITLAVRDYATMPITGALDAKGQIQGLLARVNFMREEPGRRKSAKRYFINDLNGPLYILSEPGAKQGGKLTTYLNFNGMFHRMPIDNGFANGFITFAFDPDYQHNGIFYTMHLEDPKLPAALELDKTHTPGVDLTQYKPTQAIATPGPTVREAVLLEWQDRNIHDEVFAGTVREILRLQQNSRIHPTADLIFNPDAKPGDPDWRALYIACGDSGSGESHDAVLRLNPQRLDTLVGKILRILPDLSLRTATSRVSENGQYRIPDDNPFAGKPGVRGEIWAYGLRNPARLTWEPGEPLIADVIGLNTWETVDFIHRGANYGYSLREGNEMLEASNFTARLPKDDRIPVMRNATESDGTVTPTYPVLAYGHKKEGGDAMSSGYVYRGRIAALKGKYIFGDISTGKLWWADYQEMLRADDGNPATMATIHPLAIRWNGAEYASMAGITELSYHARGGKAPHLPGMAVVAFQGRADVHPWQDEQGNFFLLSKSDGMIRIVTGAE